MVKTKIYLPKKFEEMKKYPPEKLHELWSRYFDTPPKKVKTAMFRPLWYRVQCENMGLKMDMKYITKLNRYAKDPENAIEKSYKTKYQIKNGSNIVKTYKNKVYSVKVKDQNNFEYNGQEYKTLSAVAKAICHKKVSGYDFFGLNNKHTNKDVLR